MKHIIPYNKYNEEISVPKILAGASIAASTMMNPNFTYSKDKTPIEMVQNINKKDGVTVSKQIREISKIRKNSITKDKELSNILSEIESNIDTKDSSTYIKLFDKLSKHLNDKYNYKIESRNIDTLQQNSIAEEMGIVMILGWLGSICLAVSGIPQAWMSYKEKHAHGMSWAFLLLWAFGEIFALAYVYDKLDLPLLLNYSVNILILAVILFYKISPKVDKDPNARYKSGH